MASSPLFPLPPTPSSHRSFVLRLFELARELSLVEAHKLLQRHNFSSVARRSKLLLLFFEELNVREPFADLPRSAVLCLREILVVLQRFRDLVADCSARSRMRLLLQAEAVCNDFHELTVDLSTLLDILPLAELSISGDVIDLVDLVRRQCRRSSAAVDTAESSLRQEILDMIRDVEKEIAPDGERLAKMFDMLGLDDSSSCRDEIECLEREIGDKAAESWSSAMVALVGLLRYGKCVLFGASTPRSQDSATGKLGSSVEVEVVSPADFRCPISLELMRDPVVVASGQSYDRESISRWIASGHATCPKTGQALAHTNLVPNRTLKNLIAQWCREQCVPYDNAEAAEEVAFSAAVNRAAAEAARMTAAFLVGRLAKAGDHESANRVVHELRQLARTGSDNRVFVAEAGAVPLLIPLLNVVEPAALQVNAVTALLNLSILDANKKRIMHADGGVDGIINLVRDGVSWQAKANAAATLLSLSANHSYRRRLGRNPRVVDGLVKLVNEGPAAAKKDGLAAMLSLAGDRESIPRLVESGVVDAALKAVGSADVAEEAVALLAAVAKRGGAEAVFKAEGAIAKLVRLLRGGSDWARESAAAALVLVCRGSGGEAVAKVLAAPGIEWAIWELMSSGTDRARLKAAALGRICRRWLADKEADRTANLSSSISISVPTTTLVQN